MPASFLTVGVVVAAGEVMLAATDEVEVGAAVLDDALRVEVVFVEVELEVELLSTAHVVKFLPPNAFPMLAAFVR